jgi:hypothetical protein
MIGEHLAACTTFLINSQPMNQGDDKNKRSDSSDEDRRYVYPSYRHGSIWTGTTNFSFPHFINRPSYRRMTSFDLENCDFASSGENSYFVLEPGYQVILGGQEDGRNFN